VNIPTTFGCRNILNYYIKLLYKNIIKCILDLTDEVFSPEKTSLKVGPKVGACPYLKQPGGLGQVPKGPLAQSAVIFIIAKTLCIRVQVKF
jgi:hypothetical protein